VILTLGFYSGIIIGMFLGMCLGIILMGILGASAEDSYMYEQQQNRKGDE